MFFDIQKEVDFSIYSARRKEFVKEIQQMYPEIKNIGISTKRHNFLDESGKSITGFNHWYGIDRKCPRNNELWFQKLRDLNLYAGVICASCSQKSECPYHAQFKNLNRVGFPTEYLNTKYINDLNLLFVEENLTGLKSYELVENDVDNILNILKLSHDFTYSILNRTYNDNDLNYLYIMQQSVLRDAIRNEEYEIVKEIVKFDINILKYCRDTNKYHLPHFFKIFDIAHKKPVVLLHAGFSEQFFERLLLRHTEENPTLRELLVVVYTSDVINKDTKLYQITESDFSKNTIAIGQDGMVIIFIRMSLDWQNNIT